MALLGHVTPEMTLRYAKLASPTLRTAYQQAMDKVRVRQPLPLLVDGRQAVPDRVQWLGSEMLKTRVAHGYCSRDLVAEACPTPTSASSATTSSPPPSSCPHSSTSSPTCAPSATTPKRAAGTQRQPATPASPPASKAMFDT